MQNRVIILTAFLVMIFVGPAVALSISAGRTTIRSIAFDSHDRLWVATFGEGLWLRDDSGLRRFREENGDRPFPMINNLLACDRYLYIATAGGGCLRLNTDNLRFDGLTQTAGFEKLHALYVTGSGTVYIGSVGSGTAILADNVWKPLRANESINLAWVNSIVEWQNHIWLGTATGLYKTPTGNAWKPESAELSRAINCLLLHKNVLYAGTTDRGVHVIRPGKYPEPVEKTIGQIHFLVSCEKGVIAGGDLGMWLIGDITAEEIASGIENPKCACSNGKNVLHIGTADGRIFMTEDLQKFELIFSINGSEEQK